MALIDRAFASLGVPDWKNAQVVTCPDAQPYYLHLVVWDPSRPSRKVSIRASEYDLTIGVGDQDEVFAWSTQQVLRSPNGIIEMLTTVLADRLRIDRYGKDLVVLRFYRGDRRTSRISICSGVRISLFRRTEENIGPLSR